MSKKRRKRQPNLAHLSKPREGVDDRRTIRELRAALKPFADIEIKPHDKGPACWVYMGNDDAQQEPSHFRVGDVIRARELLGL